MILHIDMDAFFASIEQAINPRLKGKPLIIGSRNNKLHTVVCAASYEAKALGIRSGMASLDAFRICPNLEFLAADQSKYIWTSQQILELLNTYALPLRYASIDEFQIDIGKEIKAQQIAEDIQKKILADFHITASVGIAKNSLLAKLASKINKPRGIAILNQENLEQILSKTPAQKLCGLGGKYGAFLAECGINTCLEIYQKECAFLEETLGQNGINLYLSLHCEESFTHSDEPEKPKSIGHSYTLKRTTQNPGVIQAWIRLLSEMVGERLRQQNLSAKCVHLWLNSPLEQGKKSNFCSQKTFQIATNDGYEIYLRSLKIMARIGLKKPKIRALGVSASQLEANKYLPLFNEQKRREELIKALDKINSRFGQGSVYPAVISLTDPLKFSP